jgi:hypothetical protein
VDDYIAESLLNEGDVSDIDSSEAERSVGDHRVDVDLTAGGIDDDGSGGSGVVQSLGSRLATTVATGLATFFGGAERKRKRAPDENEAE